MSTGQSREAAGSSAPEGRAELAVCVAYADLAAGRQAKHVCDRLNRTLAHEPQLHCDLWRLDTLRLPEFRRAATHSAEEADIVLFALHGEQTLPPAAREWVEEWLRERMGRPGALVALFDSPSGHDLPPACDYLRQAARRGGLEFFCSTGEPSALHAEFTLDSITHRGETSSSVLDEILRHPLPAPHRWGINE
jgi:hypothetical protein